MLLVGIGLIWDAKIMRYHTRKKKRKETKAMLYEHFYNQLSNKVLRTSKCVHCVLKISSERGMCIHLTLFLDILKGSEIFKQYFPFIY